MSAQPKFELPSVAPGHPIADATVWTAEDFPDDRSWVYNLDPDMVDEILAAMQIVKKQGLQAKNLRPEGFPLPRTESMLRDLHHDLECGPGFAMLSGFPLEGLTRDEVCLAYCGLGSYLGNITVQNREGEFILEVTDKGKAYDQQSRGYHSTAHLDFHNDGTNTVTLLCVGTAAEGGLSMLVSGTAVYNAILSERPDYLDALYRGFHHHRRNQKEAGDSPVTPYRTPVFGYFSDLFHMAYAGPSIFYCENEGITITAHEKAALAYFVDVVERPEMRVSMELRQGDIQFVNNYLILHARTEYRDSETQRRELLRLWLDDENSARLGPGKMDWYLPDVSRFTRIGGVQKLEHR